MNRINDRVLPLLTLLLLVVVSMDVAGVASASQSDTTSLNWSGYAVVGSPNAVTDVKGSWKVPTLVGGACPATGTQAVSFWVGIDGVSSSTVEQVGTDIMCQRGVASSYAWFEFYPQRSDPVFQVSGGDTISAEVAYTTSNSTFVVSLTDVTSGKSFTRQGTVRMAARSSAEWITEALEVSTTPRRTVSVPLPDFGIINYGTCAATVGGVTGAIGSFGSVVQQITMVSSGTVKAQPSTLSSDGASFAVNWIAPTQTQTTATATATTTSTSSSAQAVASTSTAAIQLGVGTLPVQLNGLGWLAAVIAVVALAVILLLILLSRRGGKRWEPPHPASPSSVRYCRTCGNRVESSTARFCELCGERLE